MNDTSLAHIQTEFQEYVTGSPADRPGIAAMIADQFGLSSADRLAIYYDAYRIRLHEALSEAFNKTHAYVGDETFADLCSAYIEQYPSHYRNLRWFGDRFPDFVAERLSDYPMVAELSRFEWALGLAFDAADAGVLALESLQQLDADDWETIGFVLQPSLQLLALHWNVPAIWLALEKEEEPPEAVAVEPALGWMVWRKELQPHFRSLTAYETLALTGLAQGLSFSRVCSDAAELADDDITAQIAGWLHGWITEAVLVDVNRAVVE